MRIENENYRLDIFEDAEPQDPRGFDNIAKMLCYHRNYDLGDNIQKDYNINDYNTWEELKKDIIKKENPAVIKELYLYDHSGLTISTNSFNDRWDSGQIGFVYIPKKVILKEFCKKRMSKSLIKTSFEIIDNEVKEYDYFLRGDVYGYDLYDKKKSNTIDSCSGFYGWNFWKNGISDYIPTNIKEELKDEIIKIFGECPLF